VAGRRALGQEERRRERGEGRIGPEKRMGQEKGKGKENGREKGEGRKKKSGVDKRRGTTEGRGLKGGREEEGERGRRGRREGEKGREGEEEGEKARREEFLGKLHPTPLFQVERSDGVRPGRSGEFVSTTTRLKHPITTPAISHCGYHFWWGCISVSVS
jgi:hypothetical protein